MEPISWELWLQIVFLIAISAFCIAFVKSVDHGKKPQ